jgi:phage I-like protein
MAKNNPKPIDSSAGISYTNQHKKGGEPPSGDGMEARVTALETMFGKMDAKLDRLIDEISTVKLDIAEMKGRMATTASASDVAEIKGQIATMASASDVAEVKAQIATMANASDVAEIKARIAVLPTASDVAEVKGQINSLPGGEAFGHLRGRVDSLPTTSKIASIAAIAVAVLTISNNWQTVLAYFR